MAGHLTSAERDRIAQLLHQGACQQEIAEALQRSPATISRELRRNRHDGQYHAYAAQVMAERRRAERPLTRKLDDPVLNEEVRCKLANHWSPEQIVGRFQQLHPQEPERQVSSPTIYAWIEESDDSAHWKSFLRRRGKRPCRSKNTSHCEAAARIANRPKVIESRLRIGDFEGDTVLGPAGTGGIVTLVDRQSRYTIITKISSKDAEHVHDRIQRRLRELAAEQRRSITFDNGTEFARCHRLEQHFGLNLYFDDPGCPHQRGTNENTNGLKRQYFPKGTDFRDITHQQVRDVENLRNTRPRACLGFKTPNEVFSDSR